MVAYPDQRKLDGYFFRVKREGRWVNRCFTDLTREEKETMLEKRSDEWLKSLCIGIAETMREMGDVFDIEGACDDQVV